MPCDCCWPFVRLKKRFLVSHRLAHLIYSPHTNIFSGFLVGNSKRKAKNQILTKNLQKYNKIESEWLAQIWEKKMRNFFFFDLIICWINGWGAIKFGSHTLLFHSFIYMKWFRTIFHQKICQTKKVLTW